LVVSVTPLPLYSQGKSPWYPLDRRLVGRKAVLDDVEKRKFLNRDSNSDPSVVQLEASRYTD
jgi:hypothetical protein